MSGSESSIVKKASLLVKKIENSIKSKLINDTPPGVRLKKGEHSPTIAAIRELSRRYKLADLLPYESYDRDSKLFFNTDSIGFVLLAAPATALNEESLRILNSILNKDHKSNTNIQISLVSDTNIEPILERWKMSKVSSGKDIYKIMAKNRVEYLKKGKWNSLFSDQPFVLKNMHLLISYTIPIENGVSNIHQEDISYLDRTRVGMIGNLKSAGIFAGVVDPHILINMLNGILNPLSSSQPELNYDDNNLIRSQLIDNDTEILFDSGASTIIHENEYYSILPYHVRQFPSHWPGYRNRDLIGSFLNKMLRIPCPFIISLNVHVPDQVSAKGVVKAKRTRATQMADSQIAKFATQWIDRKKDWDYTSKRVENGDRFLKVFYQVTLISPQGKEQECDQAIKALYTSLGWVLTRSRYIPKHTLLASLPMGISQECQRQLRVFGHYSSKLSWNCTNIAPWIGEWKGTETPLLLFIGRRGQITYFNHFDNKKGNFNIASAATSGAGKSFLTAELIFSILADGGRVFVFDSGHSYKNLCALLGGTYLDFSKKGLVINPFTKIFSEEILDHVEEMSKSDNNYSIEDYLSDFMPMLIELLSEMASPEENLDQKRKSFLEKAIKNAVLKHKNKTTITRVTEELLEFREESGEVRSYAEDVAISLHPYTKEGMFGKYFEGDNNIDLDNSLVVLELDGLSNKGDLQKIVLQMQMMQVNQIMYLVGNKAQKKQVIIDEAWKLMGQGRSGKFIEEGYRVARKHGGSYMTITQKVSDYHKSETSAAAMANSDFVVYLRQKGDEIDSSVKKEYIDNSDGKADVLKTLETDQGKFSELALSTPDGLAVVRFVTDPISEKTYSTKSEEVAYLMKAEKKGIGLFEAINHLIERSPQR